MLLKPCKNNLVVRFYQPSGQAIVLPETSQHNAPFSDATRTRVEVVAVSPDLEDRFKPGDFLLLRPKPALLPVGSDLCLIDSGVVEAIVLDDERPAFLS